MLYHTKMESKNEKTRKVCNDCNQEIPISSYPMRIGKVSNICNDCKNNRSRVSVAKKKAELIETSTCLVCQNTKVLNNFVSFDRHPSKICKECYSDMKQTLYCLQCYVIKSTTEFPIRKKAIHKVCKDCVKANSSKKDKPEDKTCNTCNATKPFERFCKGAAVCKDCSKVIRSNARKALTKAKYESDETKKCVKCAETKLIKEFPTYCNTCQKCKAKSGYETSETRQEAKRQWFKDNRPRVNEKKLKNYHDKYKHNPTFKLIKNQRNRVCTLLGKVKKSIEQKKTGKTDIYLACTKEELYKWIKFSLEHLALTDFTLDNYGKLWNVDHVIPLDTFNLEEEENKLLSFNWRNLMPMLSTENAGKRNTIVPEQIKKHYETIEKYHKENNLEIPENFIELYAKYLVVPETPKDSTTTL